MNGEFRVNGRRNLSAYDSAPVGSNSKCERRKDVLWIIVEELKTWVCEWNNNWKNYVRIIIRKLSINERNECEKLFVNGVWRCAYSSSLCCSQDLMKRMRDVLHWRHPTDGGLRRGWAVPRTACRWTYVSYLLLIPIFFETGKKKKKIGSYSQCSLLEKVLNFLVTE